MAESRLALGYNKLHMKQRGFTLIELLIALGVMAVFALLAYRGLDSVLRLHQGAAAHERQAQAIDRVITQLEADCRQASSSAILAPQQDGGALRLQLQRRIEGAAGNELATVEWVLEGTTLIRRTTLNAGLHNKVQNAELLNQVSAISWLSFSASASGAVQWQAIDTAFVLAQPTKKIDVLRGIGLRLTVAGKPLEKLFLLGR